MIEFINQENEDPGMDLAEKKPITDDAAIKIIKQLSRMDQGIAITKLDIHKRNLGLKDLQEIAGLFIRPI